MRSPLELGSDAAAVAEVSLAGPVIPLSSLGAIFNTSRAIVWVSSKILAPRGHTCANDLRHPILRRIWFRAVASFLPVNSNLHAESSGMVPVVTMHTAKGLWQNECAGSANSLTWASIDRRHRIVCRAWASCEGRSSGVALAQLEMHSIGLDKSAENGRWSPSIELSASK